MSVGCEQVGERLEELALGQVGEPERALLLAHVAACGNCRRQLDGVLALTDSLLALAPAMEPPAGFESRVLERLGAAGAPPVVDVTPDRSGRRHLMVAAAILLLVAVAIGGFAAGRRDRPAAVGRVAGEGRIVRADGSEAGSVRLVTADRPYVLVSIDHPRPAAGSVSCRLLMPDGSAVAIGSWSYDDVRGGVWAAGIDAELLKAVGMELVGDDGAVVATATIS